MRLEDRMSGWKYGNKASKVPWTSVCFYILVIPVCRKERQDCQFEFKTSPGYIKDPIKNVCYTKLWSLPCRKRETARLSKLGFHTQRIDRLLDRIRIRLCGKQIRTLQKKITFLTNTPLYPKKPLISKISWKVAILNWARWLTLVIPEFKKLSQEDCLEFKARIW